MPRLPGGSGLPASGFALISAFAFAAPASAPEASFASPAVRAAASGARLLAAGPPRRGESYRGGVEIDLDPGIVTYWRAPGEAGAPPNFDFSGSINVAHVETGYPAPKRIEEAGVFVAGYDSKVVFPLRVTPRDPKAPVTLKLTLNYSACGKVCLPARADLSLPLPRAGNSPFDPDIAAAESRVPRKVPASQASRLFGLEKTGTEAAWRLTWRGKGDVRAVFAEVPDPLFIEATPEPDAGGFALKLYVPGGKRPVRVDGALTIVTGDGAIEAPATFR
jgi:DsbC/DsbD-like thiol-disulfide interchange protein